MFQPMFQALEERKTLWMFFRSAIKRTAVFACDNLGPDTTSKDIFLDSCIGIEKKDRSDLVSRDNLLEESSIRVRNKMSRSILGGSLTRPALVEPKQSEDADDLAALAKKLAALSPAQREQLKDLIG